MNLLAVFASHSLLISSFLAGQTLLKPISTFRAVETATGSPTPYADAIYLNENEIRVAYLEGGQRRIVSHFSKSGALRKSLPLPATGHGLLLYENGSLSLRLLPNDTALLEEFSLDASLKGKRFVDKVKQVVSIAGTTYMLRGDGSIVPFYQPQSSPSKAIRVSGLSELCLLKCHLLPVDNRTLAIVDLHESRASVVDLHDGSVQRIAFEAPEVAETQARFSQIMSTAPPRGARPFLFYRATAASGRLFLGVGGFKLTDGMPLLEATVAGQVTRRFRLLPIAATPEQAGNPYGMTMPHRISVFGTQVASVTETGIVSVYDYESGR